MTPADPLPIRAERSPLKMLDHCGWCAGDGDAGADRPEAIKAILHFPLDSFLRGQSPRVGSGSLMPAQRAALTEDGARVPAGTSQRLACDASRVVMRHDRDGRVVEVDARTRTIPPALRRALHHRDRGCRFPGCSVRFGQGHHIRHWAQGGPTTLSNLAMLCRRHHRAVHEEGYTLDRQADGELRFRRPDGRVLPEVPPPHEVPDDPVKSIRARHEAQGLSIDARTSTPGWLGEPLDVGWAIDVLHPLAGSTYAELADALDPTSERW